MKTQTKLEELQNFFKRHAPVLWEDRWTCRCGKWALSRAALAMGYKRLITYTLPGEVK